MSNPRLLALAARHPAKALRLALLVFGALGAACDATSPTPPAANLAGVVVLYSRPSRPGESFQAMAYTIDSDGAYAEVTRDAQWTSSDFTIANIGSGDSVGGRSISMNAPGTAIITATYQRVAGYLLVRVPPRSIPPNSVGPLRLGFGPPTLTGIEQQVRLTASYSSGLSSDVTGAAIWSSSEPFVATVERGVVTSHHVGTTEVTVSYQGAADSYMVSVHPGRVRP